MMKKLFPLPNPFSKLIKLQFFSTFTQYSRTPDPNSLYRKITPIGDPSVSIVPVLDQWIQDGNFVNETVLRRIIHSLKTYKRFNHALQVSQWMGKSFAALNSSDVAMRINLISRVHGLEQVEKYFVDIPHSLNSALTHLALLNCYSRSKSVDKAESLFQKAKDLGYVNRPAWYDAMINLHYRLGNFEKIDNLMHEMEERGIHPDSFTLHALLKAYTAKSDTAGIDSVLKILESDDRIILNWSLLAVAATAYLKVGLPDKASVMLEKLELCIINGKEKDIAIRALLLLYAKSGKKDDVYRFWNQYKEKHKVYNNIYLTVMSSLLRLEDFDGVESLFQEWVSSGLSYDFKIVNLVLDAYCRLGNLEKAEAVLNEGILKEGIPNVSTWCNLAGGYIMDNELVRAIDSIKKAISLCSRNSETRLDTLRSCLEYLEGGENIDDFIKSIDRKSVPPWFVLLKLHTLNKTGDLSSRSTEDVMTDDEMMH